MEVDDLIWRYSGVNPIYAHTQYTSYSCTLYIVSQVPTIVRLDYSHVLFDRRDSKSAPERPCEEQKQTPG